MTILRVFAKFSHFYLPLATKENIQSSFLEQVRGKLPPAISLADELAELLNISRDSAYRRIRGETVLSLDEVKKMCNHFQISLDHALSPSSEMVTFQLRALDMTNFSFEKWLQSILGSLQMIGEFPDKELIYDAKDLPIFHYFQYPRLSAFKMYFWMKSFARDSKLSDGKYRPGLISNELLALGVRIWEKYAAIPSTEIISDELMNVTLRNIEFIHDCGLFENHADALALCDDCSSLLATLKKHAETGVKGITTKDQQGAKLDLFHNEVLIGSNTVLFKMGDKRVTFITTNGFDILTTSQEFFCKQTENHIDNLIRKSVPISNNAQKERIKFFNRVEKKIRETKEKLS